MTKHTPRRRRKGIPGASSFLQRMKCMMSKAAGEAQDLVYNAWETRDSAQAFDLLTQAVELDVTNVDAWLGLMDYEPLEGDEQIEVLRRLVALGEKNLGSELFQNNDGHFWSILETRPYMRARLQLALCLIEQGRFEESVAEQEGMLELNPNDNQGVRYSLLASYLAQSRVDNATRLLRQYDELGLSAVWAWGHVLERYLGGHAAGAAKALTNARKQNVHAQVCRQEAFKKTRCCLDIAMEIWYDSVSSEELIR